MRAARRDVATVEVWIAGVAAWHPALAAMQALLDDEERSAAAFFRFEAERARYTIAHGLLRLVLARDAGTAPHALRFARGPFGKPYLTAPGAAAFNLAHSADRIAIALAHEPVGVDVQACSAGVDVRAWARHEALLKAQGTGVSAAAEPDGWTVRDVGAGAGYAAAAAARGDGWRLAVRRLEPGALRLLAS